MKHLLSPWRTDYIKSFSDKHKKQCLFCRIAKENNDEENLIAWRGKECYVVMNRYPYNGGHAMVVPYLHTKSFDKISDKAFVEIMKTVSKCIKALSKFGKPDGFNFGANLGKTAGAGIDKHIHFHIVPRWNGDTNFMTVCANTKVISEDIKKKCAQLKTELNK